MSNWIWRSLTSIFHLKIYKFAHIEKKLKVFKTRKALTNMKKIGHLGEKKQPVPLLLIKFLIERKEHQGLYNVLAVLGNEFYVVNDIENKKRSIPIRLINNMSTGNKWQLILLRKGK